MSLKPVLRRQLATDDLLAAAEHYRQVGGKVLQLRFIDAFAAALEHVRRHPASGSPRYADLLPADELRCWPLKRFPYLILYVDHPDRIDLLRILHGQRDVPALLQSESGPEDAGD
jgi:toxin ParE1/3/4